jgi:hypothetical protein
LVEVPSEHPSTPVVVLHVVHTPLDKKYPGLHEVDYLEVQVAAPVPHLTHVLYNFIYPALQVEAVVIEVHVAIPVPQGEHAPLAK